MKRPRLNISVQDIKDALSILLISYNTRSTNKVEKYMRGQLRSSIKSVPRLGRVGKSGYKGIYCSTKKSHRHKPWRATIYVKGKRCHLGYFETKEEAARAYDNAAKVVYGNSSILNFPDE